MKHRTLVRFAGLWLMVVALGSIQAGAAQENSSITRVVIATSGGSVVYNDRSQANPPAIVIEFRSRNVLVELEPVVPVASGILTEIRTDSSRGPGGRNFLKSIGLILAQPVPYRISQAANQILIDIETPPYLVPGRMTRVGTGLTILGIEAKQTTLQRLEAMSAALQQASQPAAPLAVERAPVIVTKPVEIPQPILPTQPAPIAQRSRVGFWFGLLLGAGGAVAIRRFRTRRHRVALTPTPFPAPESALPQAVQAGTVLEQVVLRATQRQGHQVVGSKAMTGLMTLWIIQNDDRREGLLCLSNGPFFERKILEQFWEALQVEELQSGTVWALGGFTAPAQTFAKEHQITLVLRDEVFKLLEPALKDPALEFTGKTLTQQTDQPSPDLAQARITMLEQECATHAELKSTAMAQLKALEIEVEHLKKQLGESERTLAEEQAKRQQREGQLRALEQALATKDQRPSEVESRSEPAPIEEGEVTMEQAETEHKSLQESPVAETNAAHQDVMPAATPAADRSSASERRKWPRLELAVLAEQGLLVRVATQDAGSPAIMGVVKNVCRGGFMAEVDHELPVGAVTIELFPFSSMVLIEASGEVVWQKTYEEGSKVHVGVSIDSISKKDVNRLLRYMKQAEEMVVAAVSTTA